MSRGRVILADERFALTIERLCRELIENYGDFSDSCIVGIQPRGIQMSDRIVKRLRQLVRAPKFDYGKLDITFYRDDFRTRDKPISGSTTEIDFLVEEKRVLLIDDVLYTGRTVQAALTAIQHYGRAGQVQLMAMIDRRFNRHLPIQCDYAGLIVDALDEAYVKVEWKETDGKDQIKLFSKPK
ncbi:MAG: bifunctional pyr operon transcriptional regulator/uracil phosphoribosyltransferase PyrR [Saprospiraceae bacterium]|nr:bifunctional pyr operon transcriptional regulator/uracil phosphoribosyltransferase PyrR [Saprospiraceae bacterium]